MEQGVNEMKRILVIVAHPNLSMSKVNKTWIKYLQRYPEVTIHHLYEEYAYRPINVYHEQELLLQHDRIVFQFPLFWYSSPSLLKQWQDEVLSYLWSKNESLQLKGKELLLAITIGAPKHAFQPNGFNQYTIDELMRPLQLMAISNQMIFLPIYAFYNTSEASDKAIENSAQVYINHLFQPYESDT